MTEVSCFHQPVIVNGRYPNEMRELRWINKVLYNLQTSFSDIFQTRRFDKCADCYLGAFSCRFKRRLDVAAMTDEVIHALCKCTVNQERVLRSAKVAN